MKVYKFYSILSLVIFCCSCHYDPSFHEEYYVVNKMPTPVRITCSVIGLLDTLVLPSGSEALIKDWYNNSYGDSGATLTIWAMSEGAIFFNDSITLNYSDASASTFEKSMWKKACWEVLENNEKPRNTYYKLRYSIDEQDYKNAILQYSDSN